MKARLAAPPVYLVSLPMATLVAGAEMLGLYFLLILHNLLSPVVFPWGDVFAECLFNPLPAYFLLLFTTELPFNFFHLVFASFIGFFAAIALSGYLLGRTVRHEGHPKLSSRIGGQRLLGLLILISFAWAYMYLVAYVPVWMLLFGPLNQG